METLYNLMADISEDEYYAGWLRDLEYILWSIVVGDGKYKSEFMQSRYAEQLKALAESENKWYYWSDRKKNIENMPLDMWIRKYKRNSNKALKEYARN
jgi:hypothetical protein